MSYSHATNPARCELSGRPVHPTCAEKYRMSPQASGDSSRLQMPPTGGPAGVRRGRGHIAPRTPAATGCHLSLRHPPIAPGRGLTLRMQATTGRHPRVRQTPTSKHVVLLLTQHPSVTPATLPDCLAAATTLTVTKAASQIRRALLGRAHAAAPCQAGGMLRTAKQAGPLARRPMAMRNGFLGNLLILRNPTPAIGLHDHGKLRC